MYNEYLLHTTGEMDETETTSDLEYQQRHDRYEILEKKKYMAYMEWSLSRKGRLVFFNIAWN